MYCKYYQEPIVIADKTVTFKMDICLPVKFSSWTAAGAVAKLWRNKSRIEYVYLARLLGCKKNKTITIVRYLSFASINIV